MEEKNKETNSELLNNEPVVNDTIVSNIEVNNENNISNNNEQQSNNFETKSPKKHTGLIITAVVLFVMALAFYLIYGSFFKPADKPKDNNREEKDQSISTPSPTSTVSPTVTPTSNNKKTKDLKGTLIEKDDYGNSYIYDDDYIIKYSEDGNVIKKGSIKVKDNYSEGCIVDDNMYLIIDIDNIAYFYDFMNDSKYELVSLSNYKYCSRDDNVCNSSINLELKNILSINIYPKDNKKNKILTYIYDISIKNLSTRKEANLEGKTFKTKDGKNVLKIVSLNDSKALKEAKKYNIDMDGINSDYSVFDFDYFGYYNDKFFVIFYDAESSFNLNDSKYIAIGGTKEGNQAQGRDTHSFIINMEDNTLVDLKYEYKEDDNVYGILWNLIRLEDYYYFYDGGAGTSENDVYNENLKKIGDQIIGIDSKENFYVYYSGEVIKYNSAGDILKKSSSKYKSTRIEKDSDGFIAPFLKDDNIYFIKINDDEKGNYIFVDFMNDKEVSLVDFGDYVINGFSLDKKKNTIKITFRINEVLCKNCDSDKEVVYTYNLINQTIERI